MASTFSAENKFTKQPYEEFSISTDFSNNMLDGETITGQTVTVVDNTMVDVSSTITNQTSVSNNGTSEVIVLVRGGTKAASPYKITFRCTTSLGHKWEHDIQMTVKDL